MFWLCGELPASYKELDLKETFDTYTDTPDDTPDTVKLFVKKRPYHSAINTIGKICNK